MTWTRRCAWAIASPSSDGELVQEGTPEDILLNPANDYVQSFLQDVNRTKVLNATHAVNPARLTLTMRSRPAHAGTDARHEL